MEVKVMGREVHACILLNLIYSAAALRPGKKRINESGCTFRNCVETYSKRLNVAENFALCVIIQV